MWIANFLWFAKFNLEIGTHMSLSMRTVNKNGRFNYFWQKMKKMPQISKFVKINLLITHYTVSLRNHGVESMGTPATDNAYLH